MSHKLTTNSPEATQTSNTVPGQCSPIDLHCFYTLSTMSKHYRLKNILTTTGKNTKIIWRHVVHQKKHKAAMTERKRLRPKQVSIPL